MNAVHLCCSNWAIPSNIIATSAAKLKKCRVSVINNGDSIMQSSAEKPTSYLLQQLWAKERAHSSCARSPCLSSQFHCKFGVLPSHYYLNSISGVKIHYEMSALFLIKMKNTIRNIPSQPPTCLPPAGNDPETHQIDQADCIKMHLQSSIEHKFGEC